MPNDVERIFMYIAETSQQQELRSPVSDETLADYREIFALFDKRGDGKINSHQVGEVLRSMGENPTEKAIKEAKEEAIKSIGSNKSETDYCLTFEQFTPILQTIHQTRRDQQNLKYLVDAFDISVHDKENTGCVPSQTLRSQLTSIGEKLSNEEVTQLFMGQEDARENINYEEFIKMVMNG